MHWRLRYDDGFPSSLDELEDTEHIASAMERMILRIMAAPERAGRIGDTQVRAMRNGEPAASPDALVLFYAAEDGVVTLLRLERDEEPPAQD